MVKPLLSMNKAPSSIPSTINEHGKNIQLSVRKWYSLLCKMDHIWLYIVRYLLVWLWREVWVGQKNIHVSAGLCTYDNKEHIPTNQTKPEWNRRHTHFWQGNFLLHCKEFLTQVWQKQSMCDKQQIYIFPIHEHVDLTNTMLLSLWSDTNYFFCLFVCLFLVFRDR